VRYNPTTYEGQLESTYADDSLHLGEFPESYEGKTVQYRDGDRLQIVLDKGFHFDVGPRYYADHTWRVGSLEKYQDSSFNIPSQLLEATIFTIIGENGVKNREYKVLWVARKRAQ
jgi:hypothetical protein